MLEWKFRENEISYGEIPYPPFSALSINSTTPLINYFISGFEFSKIHTISMVNSLSTCYQMPNQDTTEIDFCSTIRTFGNSVQYSISFCFKIPLELQIIVHNLIRTGFCLETRG
jgi:hypothetical protein